MGTSAIYSKTYITPTGVKKNLFFYADGTLWVEDPVNAPGIEVQIYSATPGSFMQSITSFGREWIAFSDGLHGADVPFQYDGTNFLRATADGPGTPPTFSLTTYPPVFASSLARSNNIVSATTSSAHNLLVGYQAQITGAITSVVGTSISSIIINNENLSGIATVTTSSAHGLGANQYVTITGVQPVAVGGGVASATDVNGIVTVTTNSAHGLNPGSVVTIAGNSTINTTAT